MADPPDLPALPRPKGSGIYLLLLLSQGMVALSQVMVLADGDSADGFNVAFLVVSLVFCAGLVVAAFRARRRETRHP